MPLDYRPLISPTSRCSYFHHVAISAASFSFRRDLISSADALLRHFDAAIIFFDISISATRHAAPRFSLSMLMLPCR